MAVLFVADERATAILFSMEIRLEYSICEFKKLHYIQIYMREIHTYIERDTSLYSIRRIQKNINIET